VDQVPEAASVSTNNADFSDDLGDLVTTPL
jgi:hypothetical protein